MRNEIRPGQLRICRTVFIPEHLWMHYIVTDRWTLFYGGVKRKHWQIVDPQTGQVYWRLAKSVAADRLVSE